MSNSKYLRVRNLLLVPFFFSPSYTSVRNLFYAKIRYFPTHKTQVIRRTRNYRSFFPDLIYYERSVVRIATAYGLDGPVIESPVGARFSAPVQTGPEAHPTSCIMSTGSFPGAKCGRAWRWTLTPSSATVKNRVELHP